MTKYSHSLKPILIASLGSLALTACIPGQEYLSDHIQNNALSSQYGADYAQYNAGFGQANYGNFTNATALRPPCQVQVAPCGFMAVVPVYPIYQVAVPTVREPIVEIFEEPPAVEYFEPEPTVYIEPEPIPYVEPEPVYTPMEHWPEPSTPIPIWTPKRK